MKILFDTSVIIASFIDWHEYHSRALPWFLKAAKGNVQFFVSAHTLIETYSVLTTYPSSPKLSPQECRQFISENIEKRAEIISLNAKDYSKVLDRMLSLNLSGGAIYDALLAQAAQKAKVDYLLTFNERDFLRVWPEGAKKIKVP